jgi:lipid-A-disaccharide synthase-like uncharacterized protein
MSGDGGGSGDASAFALEQVFDDARTNAVLAWLLVGFVAVVALGNLVAGTLLWAGFAAAVVVLAVLPPLQFRTPRAMLPWEVLGLAVLPLLGRTFATVPVTSDLFSYLSVAAIALIVAVELHVFTPVKMSQGFAVSFVVIATMAAAGIWAVARFALDTTFGTGFLMDPLLTESEIEHDLMLEFVYSTAAGVLGGVVFEWYFRRIRRRDSVVPAEVEAAIESQAARTTERRGVEP